MSKKSQKMMESLQNKLKQIKEIKKEVNYNYDYKYFDLKVSPHGDILVPNEENNEKFGSSRKGYELFKTENREDLSVGYAGVVSLREIYISDTKEVIGYVAERKKSTKPYIKESQAIYDEIYEIVLKVMKVRDEENFQYYLNKNGPEYDLCEGNFELTDRKASYLISLVNRYNSDSEFKKFIDKIIL